MHISFNIHVQIINMFSVYNVQGRTTNLKKYYLKRRYIFLHNMKRFKMNNIIFNS